MQLMFIFEDLYVNNHLPNYNKMSFNKIHPVLYFIFNIFLRQKGFKLFQWMAAHSNTKYSTKHSLADEANHSTNYTPSVTAKN